VKLSCVALLSSVVALGWSAGAGQPQAQDSAAAGQVDLSGRWRFSSFGSFWTVDLKLEPSRTTGHERVFCGEAARDQRLPDTPIVKARLCAEIGPDDGLLHVEVSGATCKASWRRVGMLDGTCSRMRSAAMSPRLDDDPPNGSMPTPMGGFTAVRLPAGIEK
jgi:hypothetical protein